MKTTPRVATIASTLGLFFGAILVALLLSEGFIRLVAPQRLESYRPIYRNDSLLVYRLKANYHALYSQPEFQITETTNELGLRNPPISPKRQGTIRALGLGDSFSYSNSVNLEETFFKQIERFLNDGRPGFAEVINGAVPAYSIIQELRYLERDGVLLEPDLVIVGFYVGNDFQDSHELFDSLGRATVDVVDGQLRANDRFPTARYDRQERSVRTATMSLRAFFASNSALYVFLRERFSETLWRLGLRNNPPPPDFCAKTFSPAMEHGWALVRQLLDRMAAVSAHHGAKLLIVGLPTQYQVHEDLWTHHFTTFGLNPDEYDLDKPQRILREFCASRNIDFVDALPALREAATKERLFYPIASYMTPAGHRVVARVVTEHLRTGTLRQGISTNTP